MELQISKRKTFVPDFCENKKEEKSKQIFVEYDYPTISLKEKISAKNKARAISSTQGAIEHIEIEMAIDESLLINSVNLKINNCSYACEGESHVITTAKDLFNAPSVFAPLKAEIVKDIQSSLEGVAEKN